MPSDSHHTSVEFNDDGELWAADPMSLAHKLDVYYGVEGIHLQEPYSDESTGETHHEAMVYFDGEEYQLLKEHLTVFGHGPSGAAGVTKDDLPSKEAVQEVV